MSIASFDNSLTKAVLYLRDEVFGYLNLSTFTWQPCQQIESLDQNCSRFVHVGQFVDGYVAAYKLDGTHYRLNLIIDPRQTGSGVGSLLLSKIENEVRRAGGQYLQARILECMPESLSFAVNRGFSRVHTMRGMCLRKSDFSFDRWKSLGEKLNKMDFHATTMKEEAERGDDPIAGLAELYKLARQGWPSPDPTWQPDGSPEDLRRPFTNVSSPERFWIMKHKETYVGFTSATNRTAGTGVHPEVRNRGIATYLKAHDINQCIKDGKEYFESCTASGSMRRVNEKLGFRLNGLAEVRFVKPIS
jgi:GNAT superfamily N-acetyltransferase